MIDTDAVTVNGRRYRRPDRPLVVVCIDGSVPALSASIPFFRR